MRIREPKTGRRGVHIRFPNGGEFNAEISGIESSVQKFDEMVYQAGTNRSHIVRRFIEECAKAGRILLPEYAPTPAKQPEQKTTPAANRYGCDLFSEVQRSASSDKKVKEEKKTAKSCAMKFTDDFKGTVTV